MIKQKWIVKFDNEEHTVEYKCSPLTGKTVLSVDGESFTVKGKPLGIGLERCEMVLVGDNRGMLSVSKKGKAVLTVASGEAKEV